jgi:transglutaminase-like putative cysteine protease
LFIGDAGFELERIVMNWRKIIPAAVVVCVFWAGCEKVRDDRHESSGGASHVVTEDIQAGIEKYIEEQTHLGDGYFNVPYEGKQLRLKLVRVHTEYLSNLGPRRHFACVDLVDISGDVYDVDFFLSGDPGSMTVTETTVHKINGQPFYAWKQKRDRTWHRVPVEDASDVLLGVIRDRDEFDFYYHATLPKMAEPARMWLPLPANDTFQTVAIKSIDAPGQRRILEDQEFGNRVLFLELEPADSGKTVEIHFEVSRLEKAVYESQTSDPENYLTPEQLVPADEQFRQIAEEVVQGKKGDLVRARALYDHVIDRMRYMKYGSGWGVGDAVYACDSRTGNCSDYHSYFIALARSVDIPARFAIGAAIPSERNNGGIDGYHCWAEFYADGKWWPVDISEADKYTALATYFFGHNPANRVELSRGRDLVVDPAPVSGPINFLAYPVLEIAGKPAKAKVEFTFKRKQPTRFNF